jgi:hypothetical protein
MNHRVSRSFNRRLADRWLLEPGDGLLIVIASFVGVVWAFVAFDAAITSGLDFGLHVTNVVDLARVLILWPVSLFTLMLYLLLRIGHPPEGAAIWLLLIASGVLPGAIAGLLGVAWLHRG